MTRVGGTLRMRALPSARVTVIEERGGAWVVKPLTETARWVCRVQPPGADTLVRKGDPDWEDAPPAGP